VEGALLVAILMACIGTSEDTAVDPCTTVDALSTCSEASLAPDYYAQVSSLYFDTMDYTVDLEAPPPYSELVARWEWPPWLKLTAFGRENIETADALLALYPSVVLERDCRAFDVQPFGRCRVVFYYDAHEGRGCPIYEEFTFNQTGEVTFIEAWSDQESLLPMAADDLWAEGDEVSRLSTRVPGLGTSTGLIDLEGYAMTAAAETDPDLADFLARALDWHQTWLDELANSTDAMWEEGCGW
jgi:hypothetical protein